MGHIFISYSRKDREFVERLEKALHDKGRDTWKDEKDIPKGAEWLAEIHRSIDVADAVAFVISPNWVASEVCGQELHYALERKKRIIPILAYTIDPKQVPEELSKLNWISFTTEARFDTSVQEVIDTADTDLEWVREITRLLVRSRDWEAHRRETSYTLRGSDLKAAESLLMRAPDKDPKPSALQTEYVLASRKATIRRQRITLVAISAALIAVTLVSVVAYFQRRERRRQETIASARHLINKAEALREADPADPQGGIEESVCNATEALSLFHGIGMYSVEADGAVREGMARLAESAAHELGLQSEVAASAFDTTGRFLAVIGKQFDVVVWDTAAEREVSHWKVDLPMMSSVKGADISADGRRLATLTYDARAENAAYTIKIWDVAQRNPLAEFREKELSGLRLSANGEYVYGLRFSAPIGWKVSDGSSLPAFPENLIVSDLAFSPDGNLIATAFRDRVANQRIVRVSVLATGEERTRWMEEARTTLVRWTPDSKAVIASTGDAATVRDGATAEVLAKFSHSDPTPAWSPDARLLAERGKGPGYRALLRDLEGKEKSALPHDTTIHAMSFRPDGASLVTLSDRTIRTWKLHGGYSFADFAVDGAIEEIGFSGDSSSMYAAGPKQRREWKLPGRGDGLKGPSEVHVAATPTQAPSAKPPGDLGPHVMTTGTSPDGRYRAVIRGPVTRGSTVALEIWDASRRERLANTTVSDPAFFEFSPNGQTIATTEKSGFRVLAVKDLAQVATIYHPGPRLVKFQPGGALVGTAGRDQNVRVWQLQDEREAAVVEVARLQARGTKKLSLSPDGRWVGTVSESGQVQLWILDPGDLIAQARARVRDGCQPYRPAQKAKG